MPPTVLLALVLAFGLDLGRDSGPISRAEAIRRTLEVVGGLAAVAMVGFAVGGLVVRRVRRDGGPSSAARRRWIFGSRLVDFVVLLVYGWSLYGFGWPRVVESSMGLRGAILGDEILILLPFLLGQVAGWWGLQAGERALRFDLFGPSRGRALVLKIRQTLGLILPVALVYTLGHDVLRSRFPILSRNPWAGLAMMTSMAVLTLILSPFFVRLTYPTRRMPDGPLRERLQRLSNRLRFRCSDLLVWETGGSVVNAGVTGAVPWFRYVMITDGMIAGLDDREIEAVFGHEVGHIAHRHLLSFALFFLGSMGVLALASLGVERLLPDESVVWRTIGDPTLIQVTQAAGELAMLGFYIYYVFGPLSRGLERQADVYGCRAVSCGLEDCPPHLDPNAIEASGTPLPARLCPVGIRIFANALAGVARLNGIDPAARSWRHGSIRRRIEFLERLEDDPLAERRFQARVRRVRLALTLILSSAIALAAVSGALEQLG